MDGWIDITNANKKLVIVIMAVFSLQQMTHELVNNVLYMVEIQLLYCIKIDVQVIFF